MEKNIGTEELVILLDDAQAKLSSLTTELTELEKLPNPKLEELERLRAQMLKTTRGKDALERILQPRKLDLDQTTKLAETGLSPLVGSGVFPSKAELDQLSTEPPSSHMVMNRMVSFEQKFEEFLDI